MSRRAVRVAATALVVGAALAVLAGPRQAAAHSSLIGTSPKQGGTVTSPVKNVKLRFSEDVQARFATVAVTDPDGEKVSAGKPAVRGGTVEQPVTAFREPGKYLVGWRVVSADGHPVSGKFAFTVTDAAVSQGSSASASGTASATPKATASKVASNRQPPDDRSFVERHASHLLIGAVIVLVGVAIIIWERRRRHD